MSIPQAGLKTVEIVMVGVAAAKGAGVYNTYNVFHFRRVATAIAPDKEAISDAFQAGLGATIIAALNESWTHSSNRVRFLEDVTDPYADFTIGTAGSITGNRLPPDNTAYLKLGTALRGKSYRGAKLLSPMSESDTDAATADIWNAGAQTRLAAIASDYEAGFTDATTNVWVPCVFSKTLSNFTVVPADTITADIINVTPRKSIGRLKRRSPVSVY